MGGLTALAFVLIVGEAERFGCGKQITSYLGLVSEEDSSGDVADWDTSANGQLPATLSAGGSGADHGAQLCAPAQPALSHGISRGRKIAKVAMARRRGIVCAGCGAEDGVTSN